MLDVKFIRIKSVDVIVKLIGLHEIEYVYQTYLQKYVESIGAVLMMLGQTIQRLICKNIF